MAEFQLIELDCSQDSGELEGQWEDSRRFNLPLFDALSSSNKGINGSFVAAFKKRKKTMPGLKKRWSKTGAIL